MVVRRRVVVLGVRVEQRRVGVVVVRIDFDRIGSGRLQFQIDNRRIGRLELVVVPGDELAVRPIDVQHRVDGVADARQRGRHHLEVHHVAGLPWKV